MFETEKYPEPVDFEHFIDTLEEMTNDVRELNRALEKMMKNYNEFFDDFCLNHNKEVKERRFSTTEQFKLLQSEAEELESISQHWRKHFNGYN